MTPFDPYAYLLARGVRAMWCCSGRVEEGGIAFEITKGVAETWPDIRPQAMLWVPLLMLQLRGLYKGQYRPVSLLVQRGVLAVREGRLVQVGTIERWWQV